MSEQKPPTFFKSTKTGKCIFCQGEYSIGEYVKWNRSAVGQVAHRQCYLNHGSFPTSTETPVSTPVPPTSDLAGLIASAVAPLVKVQREEIVSTILDVLETMDLRGNTTTLELKRNDAPTVEIDSPHTHTKKLAKLLYLRFKLWLYGPAGAGKTTAVQQIAKAFGLPYGYISLNPQTSDTRILGFIDANGVFRDTEFFKRYTEGGVFAIEEVANASGNLLTALNVAVENGHAAFPSGIHAKHKDFILVCCDNTCGRGASMLYNDRRKIDAAFVSRFKVMYWPIDESLERSRALSICPSAVQWIDWIQTIRPYAEQHYPQLLVCPRATFHIAELFQSDPEHDFTVDEIVDMGLFQGLDKDSRKKIIDAHPMPMRPKV